LASPEKWPTLFTDWVMEEKLDGHRLIVEVEAGPNSLLSDARRVTAWSRNEKRRVLPAHLEDALGWLPVGIFDGELLVPGHRSYGVTELVNGDKLVFVAFDLLEVDGTNMRDLALRERRALLEVIFGHPVITALPCVRLAEQRPTVNRETVETLRDKVWAGDGEGLILNSMRRRLPRNGCRPVLAASFLSRANARRPLPPPAVGPLGRRIGDTRLPV
jgi:ATP-dependent DNA ligase